MPPHKSKDAKKVKEFDIEAYTKGFTSTYTFNGIVTNEYFQYKEIYQVLHYPDIGVEIVNYNGARRVFYNDVPGESQILFDIIDSTITTWMNSNLN
jgi:hypothetical protein